MGVGGVVMGVDVDGDRSVVACRHRPVVVPVGVVGTLHAVVAGDAMAGGRDVYVDGGGVDAGAGVCEVRVDFEFLSDFEVGGGAVVVDDTGWWGVVDDLGVVDGGVFGEGLAEVVFSVDLDGHWTVVASGDGPVVIPVCYVDLLHGGAEETAEADRGDVDENARWVYACTRVGEIRIDLDCVSFFKCVPGDVVADGAGGCGVVDNLGEVGGRVLCEEMVDVILRVNLDGDRPIVASRHRPVVVPVGVVGTLHAVVAGDAMTGSRDVYMDGGRVDAGAVFREVRIDAECGFCVEVGRSGVVGDGAGRRGVVNAFRYVRGLFGVELMASVVHGVDTNVNHAVMARRNNPVKVPMRFVRLYQGVIGDKLAAARADVDFGAVRYDAGGSIGEVDEYFEEGALGKVCGGLVIGDGGAWKGGIDEPGGVKGWVGIQQVRGIVGCEDADLHRSVNAWNRPIIVPPRVVQAIHAVILNGEITGDGDIDPHRGRVDAGAVFREIREDSNRSPADVVPIRVVERNRACRTCGIAERGSTTGWKRTNLPISQYCVMKSFNACAYLGDGFGGAPGDTTHCLCHRSIVSTGHDDWKQQHCENNTSYFVSLHNSLTTIDYSKRRLELTSAGFLYSPQAYGCLTTDTTL